MKAKTFVGVVALVAVTSALEGLATHSLSRAIIAGLVVVGVISFLGAAHAIAGMKRH